MAATHAVATTDFNSATWSERARHEVAFVAVAAISAIVLLIANETTLLHVNKLPLVATLASCLVRSVALAARAKMRQSFWLPVFTIFFDCIVSTFTHVEVQTAFWKELYKPFGVPRRDTVVQESEWVLGWYSLLHAFLLYVWLSYMTHFVLLARQAMLALLLGTSAFAGLLLAARSVSESWGQPQDAQRECAEIFLFAVGMVIQVAAKFRAERSSRQFFEHLVESKEDVVRQKVLRCQAEFQFESLRQASQAPPTTGSIVDSLSHFSQRLNPLRDGPRAPSSRKSARSSLNPSVKSAPAAMLPSAPKVCADAAALQDDGCPEDGVDCFPPSATVWVSGEAEPVPVGRLVPGQLVLCFDSLGGTVKYAKVSEAHAGSEAIDWVEVSLSDGTALTMTADHPVQAVERSWLRLKDTPVPAAALEPFRDYIMVHRVATMPVAVCSVKRKQAKGELRERVSVSVHQPDRYSILVMAGGTGTNVASMAVGSTNMTGMRRLQDQVKNTFVHVSPNGVPSKPRAVSEPRARARSWSHSEQRAEAVDWCSSASSSSMQPLEGAIPPRGEGSEANQALVGPDGQAEVVVRRAPAAESEKVAQDCPSVERVVHDEGRCRPCHLQFRGKCLRGSECNFCHLPHRQAKVRGRKILTAA
ncbi:unnamed protein product [Prorocentrum cordatum]|uniref:C3H1-type domain-containing protein n=1 Tax=Prorocentrum cordatum TaxID=2364126 RepID=A0ABN9TE43_9DINO|nr:unnamed protein product [Polarella glacialis]